MRILIVLCLLHHVSTFSQFCTIPISRDCTNAKCFQLYLKSTNNVEDKGLQDSVSTPATTTNPDYTQLVISNSALVAGTTVGAGMLALPVDSSSVGFIPSTIGLLFSWVYMLVTGLLVAEVATNLRSSSSIYKESGLPIGILAMVQNIFNKPSALLAGGLYVFIHYALLVAYISECGEILSNSFQWLNPNQGIFLFTLSMAIFLSKSTENFIDTINEILVGIVIFTFITLLIVGYPGVQMDGLLYQSPQQIVNCIPIFLLALVYHNVVPVISQRLNYQKAIIIPTLLYGTGIPLVMFILWNGLILGITAGNEDTLRYFTQAPDVNIALVHILNTVQSTLPIHIETIVNTFSIFAITTSLIGFVFGLLNYFTDTFTQWTNPRDLSLYGVVLIPPLLIAWYNPTIFVPALEVTGTFGITTLFGLVPAALAFQLRKEFIKRDMTYETFVPGGNVVLISILMTAILIISLNVLQ